MATKGAIRKDVPKGTGGKKAAPKAKGKGGRPTVKTEANMARILALLADGMSLRAICAMDGFPDRENVRRWVDEDPDFAARYVRAREMAAEDVAEELLEIADDGRNDWMEKVNKDGECIGWMVNGEAVQRSRLRVDTRKWIASKLLPKKYGEKVELAGKDGGPIEVSHTGLAEVVARLAAIPD